MRIIRTLVFSLLSPLVIECEIILGLLNHLLGSEAAPPWKRALTLEVFAAFFSSAPLVRQIYEYYDHQEEKRSIIRDYLASVVRIASEQPSLIGDRRETSLDTRRKAAASEQPPQGDGIMGTLGAAMSKVDFATTGISRDASMLRTPCIDHLDKTNSPNIPSTYIYAMALSSLNMCSEGIANHLLPLTIPTNAKGRKKARASTRGDVSQSEDREAPNNNDQASTEEHAKTKLDRTRKLPVNPLELQSHPEYGQIQLSAEMVETCWPAMLAATSTFFNARLDTDFFHALVRSFQKFTQVAGLLGFTTVRDAFLTALASFAVPRSLDTRKGASSTRMGDSSAAEVNSGSGESEDGTSSEPELKGNTSTEIVSTPLNWHHLLCLRALVNLGIALGPSLRHGWAIILLAMQRAEIALYPQGRDRKQRLLPRSSNTEEDVKPDDFGAAVAAADAAISRLMFSSGNLTDAAFLDFLSTFVLLLQPKGEDGQTIIKGRLDKLLSLSNLSDHKPTPSMANDSSIDQTYPQSILVILNFLEQSIDINVWRLVESKPTENGWNDIINVLVTQVGSQTSHPRIRERATEIFCTFLKNVTRSEEFKDLEDIGKTQLLKWSLESIRLAIYSIHRDKRKKSKVNQSVIFSIHHAFLETFHTVLEQNGEDLGSSWTLGLTIIGSAFSLSRSAQDAHLPIEDEKSDTDVRLMRASFNSVELICSDYLEVIHPACTRKFIDILGPFTLQEEDFNMSLTSITFYRRVADFLQNQSHDFRLPSSLHERNTPNIGDLMSKHGLDSSVPALWLYLQTMLVRTTGNGRVEIRHSALQTLLRILNDCGERLDPTDWRICYDRILNELLALSLDSEEHLSDSQDEWTKTRALVISGVSEAMAQHLETIFSANTFPSTWESLLKWLKSALTFAGIGSSVYAGLVALMARIPSRESVQPEVLEQAWSFWESSIPPTTTEDKIDPRPVAITQYLASYRHIARLSDERTHAARISPTLARLWQCLQIETFATPAVGENRMTEIQVEVLGNVQLIPVENTDTLEPIIKFLASTTRLPYDQGERPAFSSLSYTAVSKKAMSLLEKLLIHRCGRSIEFEIQSINTSIEALTTPLNSKYRQNSEKRPFGWMISTSSALDILESKSAIIHSQLGSDEPQAELWTTLTNLLQGIVYADTFDLSENLSVSQDADFDMAHFKRLHNLVAPLLGSTSCPEPLRKDYINSIFQNSLVHEPNHFDLPFPDGPLLENLESDHIGRVQELPPSLRSKLCYTLLETLLDLVAIKDGTPEQITVAKTAAPFLILRAGLTLRAYVKDQPLRGLGPQPLSQRREMRILLEKLVELDSEPKAFPPFEEGSEHRKKKHLRRLVKLVRQAMNVARRESEIMYAKLDRVMEVYEQDVDG